METIKKGFLYYRKYNTFKKDLNDGKIPNDSIVFIKDSNIIWTWGHEYKCGVTEDSSVLKDINDTLLQKADKGEVYTKEEIDDKLSNFDFSQDGIKATNLITLTATQYQNLVDAGEVEEDTYYFTYEIEPTTWTFGKTFPIVLGNGKSSKFTFGSTFPVILS